MGKAVKRQLVRIQWRDPADDWPWFWLIGEHTDCGCVHLQGADYPDGSQRHEGDAFWVPESDIVRMRRHKQT